MTAIACMRASTLKEGGGGGANLAEVDRLYIDALTWALRERPSARSFDPLPVPIAQCHVRVVVHCVPAVQHVLQDRGADVEAHALHGRLVRPNKAADETVAMKSVFERQHRCLTLPPSPKASKRPSQRRPN